MSKKNLKNSKKNRNCQKYNYRIVTMRKTLIIKDFCG